MRKLTRLLICLILAVSTAIGMFVAGCDCNGGDGPNADRRMRYRTFEGIHQLTADEVTTEDYLVKDGRTDYVLITPEKASEYEKIARAEFVLFFNRATGVNIAQKSDTELVAGEKFISIGDTVQQQALNVSNDELNKITSNGVRILTKDNNIYIYTGTDDVVRNRKGIIYAVYDFLEIYFNFDYYFRNCYDLDTGISTLKLRNFDVMDVPDLRYRRSFIDGELPAHDGVRQYEVEGGLVLQDIDYRKYRARRNEQDMLLPIHKTLDDYSSPAAGMHNTNEYVTPSSPGANSKWFSTSGDQLCYTARGDEQAFRDLVVYCATKIESSMEYYDTISFPATNYFTISHEDNEAHCTCETCMAYKDECGTYAAVECRLVNAVTDLIYEWMEDPSRKISQAPYKRENLKGGFFAYGQSVNCPAAWDEKTQKYVPIKEDCVPNENVFAYICKTPPAVQDVYDISYDETRQIIDAWDDVSSGECWYWIYYDRSSATQYFYDNFNQLNSNFWQYLLDTEATYFFNEIGHGSTSDSTAFIEFKYYLMTKLDWNSSRDVKVLTDKYFNAMYKDFADEMKEIFQDNKDQAMIMTQFSNMGSDIKKAEYWSYTGYLKPQIEKYRAILKDIDNSYGKTDPALAELIKSRVCMEFIQPLFITLDLHCTNVDTSPCTPEVRQGYMDEMLNFAKKYFPDNEVNNMKIADYIASK